MSNMLIEDQLVVAVDFDGTITTEPDMGKTLVLRHQCKEVLTALHDNSVRLILWTCRSGPALEEAMQFLHDEDMVYLFDTVNDQLPEINDRYAPHVARKVGADIYLDDKGMFFIPDWLIIKRQLQFTGVLPND